MQIFDTQIISYDWRGKWKGKCHNGIITSITALEFLLVQGDSPTKANYYVPINERHYAPLIIKPTHAFSKHATDRVLLDFGNEFAAQIEFCNLAVTKSINQKAHRIISAAASFLPKDDRKTVNDRLQYLDERKISVVPLTPASIDLSLQLLAKFTKRYSVKADFRNSLNDMLILGSAISAGIRFVTVDKVLAEFAESETSVAIERGSDSFALSFGKSRVDAPRESKGYVNRSPWRATFHNYRQLPRLIGKR